MVEEHRVGQLDDLLLIGRLHFLFDLAGFPALLDDFLNDWPDVVEGVITQTGVLNTFVLKLQSGDEVGMMNEENRTIVRVLRSRHDFQQPLRRLEFLWMFGKLPPATLGQRQGLGVLLQSSPFSPGAVSAVAFQRDTAGAANLQQ